MYLAWGLSGSPARRVRQHQARSCGPEGFQAGGRPPFAAKEISLGCQPSEIAGAFFTTGVDVLADDNSIR